jgi:hypothetical protein
MADDGAARARSLAGESLFTAELGAEVCARIAAGASIMAVCRDPAMPHRTTVRKWANRDPVFAGELWAAMRTARLARRVRDGEAAAALAARPPPAKGGSATSYTWATAEAICRRLTSGESLVAIVRDPAMPCYGTVYNWLKKHAEFADLYVQARQVQADWLFDEAREVSLEATPETVWVGRLRFDTIRWMTARMAPKKYCERLVIDAAIAERRAEDEAYERQPMTVIVKRFTDVTPEEEAAHDATEARAWARERAGRRGR